MNVVRSNQCGRHGHHEFQICYDPAIVVVADDAVWLLDWLEGAVAEGARFETGQTCQIGWMLAEVRLHESGDLTLWEPDMRSLPVEWSPTISNSLAHLRIQKDVVESVLSPEELLFPSMRQSAIICTRLEQGDGVLMERVKPTNSDSGWFCGCQEGVHDHNNPAELRRVSFYEAAVRYAPQIIPYLALPPGVLVSMDDGTLFVFHDGEPLEIRPGSYLDTRFGGA